MKFDIRTIKLIGRTDIEAKGGQSLARYYCKSSRSIAKYDTYTEARAQIQRARIVTIYHENEY